jgi:hypothetical protein
MLVYFDPWIAGVLMPTLIIVGLMAVPYIDENPLGNGYYTYKQRRVAIWTFMIGFLLLWTLMIIIGTFIRGPGWLWFWPGETWDHNRVIFEVNRNLSDLFGIQSKLGQGIFGAVVVGIYYVLAGWLVHLVMTKNAFHRKIFQRMSLLQYLTVQFFAVTMIALPVKMILRLLFRIKYVWVTPWFNV